MVLNLQGFKNLEGFASATRTDNAHSQFERSREQTKTKKLFTSRKEFFYLKCH